jgi:hypothetical protein
MEVTMSALDEALTTGVIQLGHEPKSVGLATVEATADIACRVTGGLSPSVTEHRPAGTSQLLVPPGSRRIPLLTRRHGLSAEVWIRLRHSREIPLRRETLRLALGAGHIDEAAVVALKRDRPGGRPVPCLYVDRPRPR